ncbi:MAG: glycosyltransferase family 2 protein, partial [Patescibacteria group bacterium]|nr:glycosyltransferase family 2 protein [Patescibacteria group bacterium]
MRISVIIPVYNEEKNIAKTIESLIKQTLNDYEIIAVNDGSTDKSVEILNKYRDKIKVIDKKQNGGQAKALNAGLKIASGSIIARTDGDSIVPSDWLERIHDNFKNNNIIAVGGFLTTIDENSYWALSNSFKDVIFNSFFKKIVTPNILPGANNAVLASELKVIGGYSDKKKYSEDSFLFFELSKRGKIMRDDNLIVRTRYPERFRD